MTAPASPLAYRIPEAAETLGISERFLRDLIAQGDIPVVELGKHRVVIRRESLEAFLVSKEVTRGPVVNELLPEFLRAAYQRKESSP